MLLLCTGPASPKDVLRRALHWDGAAQLVAGPNEAALPQFGEQRHRARLQRLVVCRGMAAAAALCLASTSSWCQQLTDTD